MCMIFFKNPELFVCLSIHPSLTVAAEVAVFVVNFLDFFDDPLILTVFAFAHDVVDSLKLFRTGQTTHKIHFALRTNTQIYSHRCQSVC